MISCSQINLTSTSISAEAYTLLLLLIGGTLCFQYRNRLTVIAINCLNSIFDCYLWFKYRNYQYQNILQSYRIIGFYFFNENNWCYQPMKWDLRIQGRNLPISKRASLCLHYRDGADEYLLPVKSQNPIQFPYTVEEMEFSYKKSYESIVIDTKTYYPNDDTFQQVMRYAGPKGNFYSDTLDSITPAMIRDNQGQSLIHHHLLLKTIFQEELTFDVDQIIHLDENFIL